MVRRVKAYLAKMPVIQDEDVLQKMSLEVEPPPASATSNATVSTTSLKVLSSQNSSASLQSQGVRIRDKDIGDC